MNQTIPLAALPQVRTPAIRSLPLAMADVPVLALGALVAASFAAGLLVPTVAGGALAGLSLLVTLVVLAFARRQFRADPRAAWFARMALALAIATVLMALAGHALLLVAAWIVTGRLMAGMIGHVGDWSEAQAAARRANVAFAVGDLALVAGVLLLALGAGSGSLAAIAAAVPAMPATLTVPAAFLLVIAALARCALPPFSSWLMRSLAAPTPVSALMHAGFVNAGGFLLIRYAPVLEAAPAARFALFAAGLAAALAGSVIMLVRSDVKGGLAASTVAQMGFMLLTVALGAYPAALWHLMAHGVFKAWLFLGSAGTIASAPARAKALPQPWPAVIALVTLIGALALVASGQAGAGLGRDVLPVGVACAALLSALAIGLGTVSRGPLGLLVVAAPLLLVALNAAALVALALWQPHAAVPLISDEAQLGLLALLLAGWVIQQSVASGAFCLPPALHARLVHAGNPAA